MQVKWPRSGSVLLVGSSPIEQLAFEQAKKVLCEGSPESSALFDAGTHSDFRYIHPESNSEWIKIDQVRDVIQWAMGKPQISTKQVVIISPAHALNIQAANAFLKTLEEPSPHILFILVTDKPSFIPATIRSRCFWMRIRSKSNLSLSLSFSEASALKGSMLKDLEALHAKERDPISISAEWIKQNSKQVLQHLLVILNENLLQLAENNQIMRNHRWWKFLDNVVKAKRSLEEPNQPNVQLLIESLLIEYTSFVS